MSTTNFPKRRLIYLFGMPGSGKTHIGSYLSSKYKNANYQFQFYDADQWLPEKMIQTLKEGNSFTSVMRDGYYNLVNQNIEQLLDGNTLGSKCLVIAQATYKNIHRERLLLKFPFVELWMVVANDDIRVQRVMGRNETQQKQDAKSSEKKKEEITQKNLDEDQEEDVVVLPEGSKAADVEWVLKHSSGFELPTHRHVVLVNDSNDSEMLKKSIDEVLKQ